MRQSATLGYLVNGSKENQEAGRDLVELGAAVVDAQEYSCGVGAAARPSEEGCSLLRGAVVLLA